MILISCTSVNNVTEKISYYPDQTFKDYWFQGKAEVSTYNVIQPRYGVERNGKAVLIFVTEPFSKNKLAKLDNEGKAGSDAITVLKYNYINRFTTGIYDYSQMKSVFTPVSADEIPSTLKITYSNQDWCGQYFTVIKNKGKSYEVQHHSYFESDADKRFKLSKNLLEDEILNLIRVSPEALPKGAITMVPNSLSREMIHKELQPEKALATFETSKSLSTYTIKYSDIKRTVIFRFKSESPYTIMGWEETFVSKGKEMTFKATLDKQMMTAYWSQNGPEFNKLRKELGLE